MEVNVGDAAGRHRELVPDGALCSAGRGHILYVVWQRSDSPEAFYGCSDVLLGNGRPDPNSGPDANPDPDPDSGPRSGPRLEARIELGDDWGAGYCATGTVTNDGTETIAWESVIDSGGTLAASWNGVFADEHVHGEGDAHHVRVVGADWNRTLGAAQSTSFGFCADRQSGGGAPDPPPDPQPPAQDVSIDVTTTTDWGAGYCANATVTNPTGSELEWEAALGDPGQISSIWNAAQEQTAAGVSVSGAAWNGALPLGGNTTFGFRASR